MSEADLPAQQPQTEQEARFPAPHADARRARDSRQPPPARPHPSERLIGKVRGRAAFAALSRAPRIRSGALLLAMHRSETPNRPLVAFSISRSVGNAVARNRIRRRLRAAVTAAGDRLQPGTSYLVQATPAAARRSYAELAADLTGALDRVAR
jgi:ribonuclease P protein component